MNSDDLNCVCTELICSASKPSELPTLNVFLDVISVLKI